MSESAADLREPLAFARRYAALSGPFRPQRALRLDPGVRADEIAVVASQLAAACDTNPAGSEGRWLMRMPERRHELKAFQDYGQRAAAIEWRRSFGTDPATDDLHAVLLDRPPLSRAEIETALENGAPRELLERIVVALDWAGELAAAHDLLPAARSAIAVLDQRERLRKSTDRAFVGRLPERKQVADWLEHPIAAKPVTCLYIEGVPSIGKSSMLAEAVGAFHQGRQPLILRFDFDWAGLNVQDQLGFTMEAARQLAQQLGRASGTLLEARLDAIALPGGTAEPTSSQRTQFPTGLARRMATAAAESGRPLLVVLDTLEVLRGKGETHPPQLFAWLDALVDAELKPMRVVAAGRGGALGGCPERIGVHVRLDGLDEAAADELLGHLGVPPAHHRDLIALAEGNPLKLRLGAEIIAGGEAVWLRRRKRKKEISTAYLYRFLESRVGGDDLKRIVNPGLIVRRISADLIHDVLAPRLRLRGITRERAEALMRDLAALPWLVDWDPGAPGFLRHRPEMRALLLPLLYRAAPKSCAAINAGASDWFAKRTEPWCRAEALYHQLQLPGVARSNPRIDWEAARQLTPDMLNELPPAARDLVHAARGERSGQLRGDAAPTAGDDPTLMQELLGILQRQDWLEGRYLVERARTTLEPVSTAADAVRAYLWRTGRWHDALRLLRERDHAVSGDDDLESLPPAIALARLEMRAEFAPAAFLRRFGQARPTDSALLANLDKAAVAASDNVARQGAMAFLLSPRPERWPFSDSSSRDIDPVAAARALWVPGASRADLDRALHVAGERFGTDPNEADTLRDAHEALRLASLTPYTPVVGNLITVSQRSPLPDHARKALSHWAGPYPDARGVAYVDDPLPHITGLGLFAEWAGAAAFVTRDPNLRLIGRAAERWRRTMAGDWSYGHAPPGWRTRFPDAMVSHRIADLLAEPNPREAGIAQLGHWSDGGAAALAQDLRWRLCATLAHAAKRRAEGANAVATRLLERHVPTAFIPALAVMTSIDHAQEGHGR